MLWLLFFEFRIYDVSFSAVIVDFIVVDLY